MTTPHRRIALSLALSALLVVSTVAASGAVAASQPSIAPGPDDGTAPDPHDFGDWPLESAEGPADDRAANGPDERSSDDPAVQPDGADGSDGAEIASGLRDATGETEVIVQFEDPDPATLRRSDDPVGVLQERSARSERRLAAFAAERSGVTVQRSFWITNAALVTVDGRRTSVEDLASVPGVVAIHPNYEGERLGAVAAPGGGSAASPTGTTSANASYTHGLETMNVPAFWDQRNTRGDGVHVVVIDSGVDEGNHSGLDVIDGGWAHFDADGNQVDSEPHDPNAVGHGTHVSGIVAGNTTDDGTHYGVAPAVELMVASDATPNEGLVMSATLAAFEWALAHENDVDVITTAHSFGPGQSAFVDVIRNARASGIVVTGAVGNAGPGTAGTPGDGYDVISVGAVDAGGTVTSFSGGLNVTTADRWSDPPAHWPDQYTLPTLTAPGADVVSASVGGGYDPGDGTSYAAPHVAGAAALLLANEPGLGPAAVEQRLVEHAVHPDGDGAVGTRYGHGVVDVFAASQATPATIEGVVTVDGHPAGGVTVETESGYATTTDDAGRYELPVPAGNHTVVASALGYEPVSTDVSVPQSGTAVANFSIDTPASAVTLADGAPADAVPGETISLDATAINADAITVSAPESFDRPNATTLTVDGQTVDYGASVPLDCANETVSIDVTPEAGYFGRVAVTVTASGNGSDAATAGATRVHGDVVRFPDEVGGWELPAVVEFVRPNTTIELADGTFTVAGNQSNVRNASIVVDEPITLTAAPGASPTVSFEHDTAIATSILVNAAGTEISGIDFRGNGNEELLRVRAGGSDVRNSGFANATVGVLYSEVGGARVVGNEFRELERGIETYAYGSSSGGTFRIGNNTIENATDTGIEINGARDARIEIVDNAITVPNRTFAFGIDAYSPFGDGIVVADNAVTAVSEDGWLIRVGRAEGGATIEHNVLRGGSTGIELRAESPAVIRENDIAEVERGIKIGRHGSPSVRQVVEDNRIVNEGFGVILSWGNGSIVRDNVIDGDPIFAINVGDSSNVTVSRNRIRGETYFTESEAVDVSSSRDVVLSGNRISEGIVEVQGTRDAIVRNTTFLGPIGHVRTVGVFWLNNGTLFEPTVNVTVTGTSGPNATSSAIWPGSRNVSVTGPASIARFTDDWLVGATDAEIRNLTLADGSRLTLNGTNATVGLATSDASPPENRTVVGPTLAVNDTGAESWVDVELHADDDQLAGVENDTLALARWQNGTWSTVASASVNGSSVAASNVSSFGTVAFVAEPDPSSGDGGDGDGGDTGGGPVFVPAPPSGDDAGASPAFSLASVDLGATEVEVGERVTVEVRIDNDGDANGDYTAALTVDGEPVDEATVGVNSNWHETVTLATTFDEPGTYELAVDGEPAGTVEVTGVPDVSVANASVDRTEVEPGESVTVTATLANDGHVEGTENVSLIVDGERVDGATVAVAAGSSRTVTFEHDFESEGNYTISLDGEQFETERVATIEVAGDGGADGGALPGFGPVVALVGLLGGALIAARRR